MYRNKDKREAVFAFRGTSSPQDMLTDTAFTLAAYCPGDRPPSRSPEEVAAEIADEDVTEGPMGSIFSAIDVGTTPLLVAENTGAYQKRVPLSGLADEH